MALPRTHLHNVALRNEMGFSWCCGQEVSVAVPQNTGWSSTSAGKGGVLQGVRAHLGNPGCPEQVLTEPAAFFQHQNITSGLRLGSGTWKTAGNEVLLGNSSWLVVVAAGVHGWVHRGFYSWVWTLQSTEGIQNSSTTGKWKLENLWAAQAQKAELGL